MPKAKVHARIITTPQHAKMLLKALKDNIDKFESRFGEIKVEAPPNQHFGFVATEGGRKSKLRLFVSIISHTLKQSVLISFKEVLKFSIPHIRNRNIMLLQEKLNLQTMLLTWDRRHHFYQMPGLPS